MRMSGLLSTPRDRHTKPGVTGVARVDRDPRALPRRLGPGDIAVFDRADLDGPTAEALVAAGAVAVVNAAPSISGRYPNLGPDVLLEAGVVLVDGVGEQVFQRLRDGARVRLYDGGVFVGDTLLARGTPQTPESVGEAVAAARQGMSIQLEAFSANTTEFVHREQPLLLDGVGVPDVRVPLAGQHVVVVTGGADATEDLLALRRYLKEYRPVLIGVGSGADTLWAAGHRPDLIVGDPVEVSDAALSSGADVVVPAFADGHAPGLNRVQDLGASAVTFPASGNPEDLALLLAHHHGAALIVTVGYQASLAEFLDRGRSGGNASTFLTRIKVGDVLVDSRAVAALHRSPVSGAAVAVLIGAMLLATVAALLVSDAGPALLATCGRGLSMLVALVKGWL